VRLIEPELDTDERLLVGLLSRVEGLLGPERRLLPESTGHLELIDRLRQDADSLLRFSGEDGPIAHSLLATD
jgi:hypothetical protein